jgi:hypothetical protein
LVGLVFAAVFGFALFRALFFHQEYIHPKKAARIHNKNLEFLIFGPHDATAQGISWVTLILISVGLATTDFLLGAVLPAAFGLLIGVSLPLLLVFWQGVVGRQAWSERKKV